MRYNKHVRMYFLLVLKKKKGKWIIYGLSVLNQIHSWPHYVTALSLYMMQ